MVLMIFYLYFLNGIVSFCLARYIPSHARFLHHSPACLTLDRDHPQKKFVSKKLEEMDQSVFPEGEDESKIEEFRYSNSIP